MLHTVLHMVVSSIEVANKNVEDSADPEGLDENTGKVLVGGCAALGAGLGFMQMADIIAPDGDLSRATLDDWIELFVSAGLLAIAGACLGVGLFALGSLLKILLSKKS